MVNKGEAKPKTWKIIMIILIISAVVGVIYYFRSDIERIIDPVKMSHCEKRYGKGHKYRRTTMDKEFEGDEDAYDEGYEWMCSMGSRSSQSRGEFKKYNCPETNEVEGSYGEHNDKYMKWYMNGQIDMCQELG